jgi:DNA helicase-2/ATP-dependent DNA helicase PcrA
LDRIEALLSQLDPEQRAAVSHGEGPLLVVAGAGSGKTRVLTYRIAYLLAAGLAQPHEVLAVTFTNKAAREMVERVEALLGGRPRGGFVGTFHRFALQLLRNHPREAGLPQRFAIADEDDQRRTLERVLKRLQIEPERLPSRSARSRISAAKNALLDAQQLAAAARFPDQLLVAEVYDAYQGELKSAGAIDFDDMLLLSVRLLEREEAIRRGLGQRFRWILVDEYQDTNEAQARLLSLLAGKQPNLTVVGDEDQSIYRWRGAQVENILRFDQTYPGAKVVTLGRNYRSAEPILRAAAAVIANNTQRRPKKLSSEAGAGVPVTAYQAADEIDEARFVAAEIERLRGEMPPGETAILFRINAQSRPFEAELVRRGIPYVVVAGTRFWERAEIKDAVAYLRLLVAPDDTLAFRRAVGVPPRGIGDATIELLERAAAEWAVSLPEAARRAPATLSPRARLALERFFGLLVELREMAAAQPAEDVVASLLDRSGLAAMYAEASEEDRARRANLDELVAAAAEAHERGLDLAGFMDEVALVADADLRVAGEAVQLSTLHAAKGLEFDAVFLVGMEDGLLPLRREGADSLDDLEEERRLAYVGITRARKRLHLTAARLRRLHGKQIQCRLSPFFHEVPPDVLDDRTAAAGRDPFRASLPRPSGASSGGWGNGPRATGQGQLVPGGGHRAPGTEPPADGPRVTGRGPRTSHPDGWRPGLKVRHASFGAGVILQVQGTGAQARVVVYFDRAGRKTLIPALARLERA